MIHQVLWCFLHFLLLFCCCTIECNNPFAQCLEHFYERGVLELDLLPRDKIQDGTVKKICTIFSLSNLSAFVQKTKKNKWADHTSTTPKRKFFMEFTLSSKYLRKCNRFSIVIINKLHDWCHWRTWRLDWSDVQSLTNFLSWFISTGCIKLGVVRLCTFCVVMQIT